MRSSSITFAVVALLVSLPAVASASWWQPHTRQEAIPIAEVERPLLVGKSWLVFDLDFSWKQSRSHFLAENAANVGFTEGLHFEKEKNEGQWNYRRWEIGMTWGVSRSFDLYARIPIVWGSVWNNRMVDDEGGRVPIHGAGLGDVQAGLNFQALRTQSEDGRFSNALTVGLDMRMPTGAESPGSYIGGPNNVPTIITGAGTWGWDFNARFKQQIAILALEVGLGFEWNPTNTVMYLVEDVENQFNQHLDAGDRIHGDVGVTVQFFENLALRADVLIDYRTPTRWGATVNSFPACKECEVIPNSSGLWMDLRGTLMADFDRHFALNGYFEYTLGGRRNFLWPLEDISPSRGWTAGGNFSVRF